MQNELCVEELVTNDSKKWKQYNVYLESEFQIYTFSSVATAAAAAAFASASTAAAAAPIERTMNNVRIW